MEREVSEVDRKLFLKKTYLDKIDYFITRNPINQDELYSLIRKFFGEYLKLDYEFTYEELSQELNKVFIKPKVKEHIDDFLIRLSETEYLEESTLGTIEINGFLKELTDIIQNIIYDDRPVQEEETLIEKVLKIKHKEQNKYIDATVIKTLIEELNFHITSGNINIAKKTYIDILKAYDTLHKDDKNRLHDDMNDAYERLQALIKNPKAQATQAASQGSSGQQSEKDQQKISDNMKKVMNMIDETLFYINATNLDSAKRNYAKTLKVYESLNSEDKTFLHPKVNDLYDKLQALSSKSKGIGADVRLTTRNTDADASTIGELPVLEPLVSDNAAISNSDTISINLDTLSSADVSSTTSTGAPSENIALMSDSSSVLNSVMTSDSAIVQDVKGSFLGDGFNVPAESTLGSGMTTENFLFTAEQKEPVVDEKTDAKKKSRLKTKEIASVPVSSPVSASVSASLSASALAPTSLSRSVTDTFPVILPEPVDILKSIKSIDKKSIESKIAPQIETKSEPKISAKSSVSIPASISPVSTPASIASIASTSAPVSIYSASTSVVSSTTSTSPSALTTDIIKPSTMGQSKISKSMQPIADSTIDKLNKLLRKINDDVLLEKLEKAKDTYKDALVLYRSMNDPNKAKCYQQFYIAFKKLDEALHQKSLSELLDKHLSESENSHRPMAFDKSDDRLNDKPSIDRSGTDNTRIGENKDSEHVKSSEYDSENSEFSQVSNMTTLPIMLSNDSETTRVYELVEESYFNMDNNHPDLAMHKYFKALELYHKLPVYDKKRLYSSLYELFKSLSIDKRK